MEPPRPIAPRPLLWLGLCLAGGSALGLASDSVATPVAALLAAVLVGRLLHAARGRGRPAPVWIPLVLLLACARAQAASTWPPATPAHAGPGTSAPADSSRIVLGRYRALGGGGLAGSERGTLDLVTSLDTEGARGRRRLLIEHAGMPLASGEWIAIPAEVERIPWPRGPAAGSLGREFPGGVTALLPDEVVRIAPRHAVARSTGAWLRADLRTDVRAGLARRLDRHLSPAAAAFARAMLVGDREGLDPGLSDLFTRTGTRHVLAVSGLHVALFSALLPWPLAALIERRLRGRLGTGLAFSVRALGVAAFAFVAGGGAPVQRAALALLLAALAPVVRAHRGAVTRRRADGLSLWGVALAIEVLRDPGAVGSLSVQLSYLATLGLLVATGPLARRITGLPRALRALRGNTLGSGPITAGAGLGHALQRRVARIASFAVAASCAAVLATLPVAWSRFGEIAPIGVLCTPAIAPLVVLVMASAWIVLLVPNALAAAVAERGVSGLLATLELADRLPASPYVLPERPGWLVLLAATTTLAFLTRPHPLLGRLSAIGFGALLLPWSLAPAAVEVHALDVGHGTAVVLRAPGLPALVFDAGSRARSSVAREALEPLLARWEVQRVAVVLSHDDRDHASGLSRLVERHPPRLWAGTLPSRIAGRLPRDCVRLDTEPGALRWREGTASLALMRGSVGEDNEGSRSLEVRVGETRLLLCGDAEEHGLGELLREEHLEGETDLLLFPHHGSDTPWIDSLLSQCEPREIWISGPLPELARELDRRGRVWRCTGREGPLSFRSDTKRLDPGRKRMKRDRPGRLDWSLDSPLSAPRNEVSR